MNALIAAVDQHGNRISAVVPCTWEFRAGGVRLVGIAEIPIIAEGVATSVEIFTPDGEHVYTTKRVGLPRARLRKGDIIVLRVGEIDMLESTSGKR
ncbi:hypothetical protein [Variovorax sp. AFSI2.2]|uniref:hypothetical protein n=1 Tax=Variovorax sp. AFSI2.2 TaxID=3384160 RepID=UPI003EC01A4F